MTMHNCIVDDANGNLFHGMTDNCDLNNDNKPYEDEEHRPVWAFIDRESGFGRNVGEFAMLKLKKAGSGHFVA